MSHGWSSSVRYGRGALSESRDAGVTVASPPISAQNGKPGALGTQTKKERIGWEGARRSASLRKMSSARPGARGLGGKKTEQTANRSYAARLRVSVGVAARA